jgi:restriction endonuclease S subunit
MRLDAVIKSLSVANAAIKNTASPVQKDGWYPTFSASGQDVWLPDYRFDQRGIVVSAVGARCGKAFKADGRWSVCANTHALSVDENIADRDYCWYMLNNENWWIKGGTAQPFVKVKDSLKREHSFPTLSFQKRIVRQLDQVNHIITLRQHELSALDDLIKARFVEMFGGYTDSVKLSEVSTVTGGVTKTPREIRCPLSCLT